MIKISYDLPSKYRLYFSVTKRRKDLVVEPFLPDLGKIWRLRAGNKISGYFRHIFEHKKIYKVLGANLALFIAVSSFIPQDSRASQEKPDYHVEAPLTLKTNTGIQYPLGSVKVTQGFRLFHPGIDMDGLTGDTVKPIMAGKIQEVEHSKSGYGNSIIINHGNGITSLYAHLSKIEVKVGQEVKQEEIIGKVGKSGHASGDHLHLEIRENGRAINPLTILPK